MKKRKNSILKHRCLLCTHALENRRKKSFLAEIALMCVEITVFQSGQMIENNPDLSFENFT